MKLIFKEIIHERKRQDNKWGIQNHNEEYWLSILGEEFGEVCKAVCEKKSTEYRAELIHLVAVAVAMIECYDRSKEQE